MRYSLTADFEDDSDIEAFMKFIQYHSKRLKCPTKDVFVHLAREWEKQQNTPVLDLTKIPSVSGKPRKKRATRQPYKDDEDSGYETSNGA